VRKQRSIHEHLNEKIMLRINEAGEIASVMEASFMSSFKKNMLRINAAGEERLVEVQGQIHE
jgi:hypothetical protein